MNTEDVKREWFEKDYYKILGVPKNSSQADIKKAYRKLAQKFHPDANQGNKDAEERFKEVSSAYDVLGDEEKRKQYDEVREMAASGFPGFGGQGAASGGQRVRAEGVPFDFGESDFGDLFGGLFGGARGASRRQPSRGNDLETEVRISFDDAMRGTTIPLSIPGPAPCPTCAGSGAEPGTSPVVCPKCHGSGSIAVNQGPFSIAQPCDQCGGSGRVIEKPCKTCRGTGTVQKTRKFSVRIPPGVKDGARIRVSGRGESGGRGASAGDLYVRVRVEPHKVFGRKGNDLTVKLPVTYSEAALGANVPVPTLNGAVTLKIPPGTASGRTFRVKGKGAPKKKGQGDLLVTVDVDVPKKLSKEEKELLSKLREAEKESPRAHLGVEKGGRGRQ
ncbi:MAG: molecular chaperone DnaJ [Actinomycetota bacterium]